MSLAGAVRYASNALTIRRTLGISFQAQYREYRRFRDELRVNRAEFWAYQLWDVTRPLKVRMTTMSNVERRAIEYRINPRELNDRVRNKSWTTDVLQDAGIPVGTVLCLITLRDGVAAPTTRYPFESGEAGIRSLLRKAPEDGIVVKPDNGLQGRSVHVFRTATVEGLVALDGTPWTAEQFRQLLQTEKLWKVEQRIRQHPELARIAGETLGTLRLTTFRMLDGSIHHAPATWKIPIGLSGLDHFSHGEGQLASPIDPVDGKLGPARRWLSIHPVDHHPLTESKITGETIPHWKAACDLAETVSECFPELGSIGCDIAITEDGPIVVEVNPFWGERIVQAPGPRGLIDGKFREFLVERELGDLVNLRAR